MTTGVTALFLARTIGFCLSSVSMKRLSVLVLLLLLLSSWAPAQAIRNFTDDDYQKTLRNDSRVLFYSFSPSMPLSLEGLKEVRPAHALHATVVVLADPAAAPTDILRRGPSDSIPEEHQSS